MLKPFLGRGILLKEIISPWRSVLFFPSELLLKKEATKEMVKLISLKAYLGPVVQKHYCHLNELIKRSIC